MSEFSGLLVAAGVLTLVDFVALIRLRSRPSRWGWNAALVGVAASEIMLMSLIFQAFRFLAPGEVTPSAIALIASLITFVICSMAAAVGLVIDLLRPHRRIKRA